MANNNLQTSLTIKAGVKGIQEIDDLATSIKDAGMDVEHLGAKSKELAKTFDDLSSQQNLITKIKELDDAIANQAQTYVQTANKANQLKEVWGEQKAQVNELKQTLKEQAQILKNNLSAYNQKQKSIQELTLAIQSQGDATGELGKKLDIARQQSEVLANQYTEQKQIIATLSQKYDTAKDALHKLSSAQKKVASEAEKVEQEYKKLKQELQATKLSADQAGLSIDNLADEERRLAKEAKQAQDELGHLTQEAKRLKSIADAKIAIGLTDYQKTQNELNKVKQAFKDLKASGVLSKKELKIATEQYENKVKELNQELGKTPFQLKNLTQGVSGLMASLGVGVGLAEIVQLSDEFNNLEARVRLATQSGGDFHHAMASIKEIADSTMMPLSGTADLFTKLTQSTKELGYSQSDVLGLTKTISESIATSGASAEQASNGLQQLSQAMMGGKVQAEEWNSMIDSIPTVLENVASGLGMTMGELRQHMLDGKLSAEQFLGALQAQAPKIAQEFAQMPQTVSGSLTVLKNNLLGFVGELDNELGGSDGVAGFIKDIAAYIDEIDHSVIESLSNALSSLGVLAKSAYDGLMTIPNALSDIVNGFMGMEEGGQQLSLLKGLMDGLALTTGAVADGMTALNVVCKLVFGGIVRELGLVVDAFGMVTGVGRDLAKSLIDSGQAMIDNAEQIASNYESRLGKAMDTIATDSQTKLQQVANTARAKYEQMAQDGQASATALENAFKDYAQKAIVANNGVVDSTLEQELTQKGLQAVVDETGKVIISSMDKAKKAVDGVDLSKHAESFKALGIDIQEFATGIDSKASTALSAFDELAGVVGQDIEQLGKLYQATAHKIGDNDKAQEQLNSQLLEAVDGNNTLANAVKLYAQQTLNAKSATDAQNKALAELGINMSAVNAGMSDGGQKIAQSLNVGLTAIKNTATSATALKTALSQAFDTATTKAQTTADFTAIKTAIEQAGLASHLTAEQVKTLNTGMMGGSEAVKKALADEARARQIATTATDTQTKATTDNTTATQANATAKTELANATDKATQATEKQAVSEQKASAGTPYFVANMRNKILALSELGASTERLNQVNSSLYDSLNGMTFGTLGNMVMAMEQVNAGVEKQIEGFKNTSRQVDDYTKRLSGASVSAEDLAIAQNVLANATNASINGINVMDKARLDNLKAQIDSVRDKFKSLADEAKNTKENLESELARMQGDDDKVAQLEQARKMLELQKRLDDAKKRGNNEEIAHLQQALALQQQIHAEQNRQRQAQKAEQAKREKEQQTRQTPTTAPQGDSTRYDPSGLAREVAENWEKRLQEAENRGAKRGAEELMKRLASEGKRRAN